MGWGRAARHGTRSTRGAIPRRALAVVTGWAYRFGRRIGITTSAERRPPTHVLPRAPEEVVAGPASRPMLRVTVLGRGPAEGPGVPAGRSGFAELLANAIAAQMDRRVTVRTLSGVDFELPALAARLADEHLAAQDALVVTAAYRPEMAEVPLARWTAYVEGLRQVLVDAAGPGTVVRVLSLPWARAAREARLTWGGLFGNRVRVVSEIGEALLPPGQPALPIRLQAPVRTAEWIGLSFSAQTSVRWAEQVAAELRAAWRPQSDRGGPPGVERA